MKVTYPLKEITDDTVKDKLGSTNKYGKYPIGIHNAWHGGLHLEGSAKELQAIAEGRIIAYRLDKEEKETSIDIEIDKEQKYNYSSSFILMQHDYKSPEGLEMTFYSVYHHLLSKTGIETAGFKLPKFLTKTESKVKKGLQQKIHGLQARAKTSYATVEFVIPKGAIVTLDDSDTLDTHWSRTSHKASKYKKVYYTDLHDTTHYDIYIPTSSKNVTADTNNNQTLTITTANNGKNRIKRAEKGEHLRETGSTTGTIITVVKPKTKVTVLEESKNNYTKVKYTQENGIEQEGYIYTDSLEKKETFDKEILDKIQISDLKIKAGQHIGYIGKYGIEKKPNYIAAHLEIFTTDNIKDFLENTKKDGEDKKHFAKIPKGTKLKTNLLLDVDIKENTPIKVLKLEGDYAQVKIEKITNTLVNETELTYHTKPTKHYTIVASQFGEINKKFNDLLNLNTKFNKAKNVKFPKGWETTKKRIITFYPEGYNKKYWIPKADLSQEEIRECNEEDEEVITYKNATVGSHTKTDKAITKAYIEPPTENCDEETGETVQEETVNKEHITNLQKFKKVKGDKKEIWYKAVLTYKVEDKEETKKGWLAEKDIELFSAYQWEQFGFQHLNAGSEFVYSLADIEKQDITKAVEEDKISKFVKTVWDIIDVDKTNKKLSPLELEIAFEDSKKMEILSKLVCTHKCEWAYDIAIIKSEAAELYDIALGNNPSDTLKKQKESRILALESRMTALMFWNDASGEYKGVVDAKLPARKFPSKDMVHYFHPIAWVRQMKLINGDNAPWMKFVLEEAIKYKGIKETVNPLAKAVQDKYHTYIGHPKATSGTSWCASFASWSLGQAEFNNPKSWSSQKFLNHKSMKQCDIQYGAIAVFTDCDKNGKTLFDDNNNSHGHVTFVIGKLKNSEKYACLGGNQGNMLKVSDYDCSFKVFAKNKKKTKFRKLSALYIPKKYNDKSNNLHEYNNINDANKKIIKANIKTKTNEST